MATTISSSGTTTITATTADDTVTFAVAGVAMVICRGSGSGGLTDIPGAGGPGGQSTTKTYAVAAGAVYHYKIAAGGAVNTAGGLTSFGGLDTSALQYAGGGGDGNPGKGDLIRAGGTGGSAGAGGGGGGGSGAGDLASGGNGASGGVTLGGVAGSAPAGGGAGGTGGFATTTHATAGAQPGGGGGGKGGATNAAAGGNGSITVLFTADRPPLRKFGKRR